MSRLEELADDWAEGALDAQGAAELRRLLCDPANADRFVVLCGERRSLREALRGDADETLTIAWAQQRRRLVAVVVGGVAVAAALILAVQLWPTGPSARRGDSVVVGRVSAVAGAAWLARGREREVLAKGRTLHRDDRIVADTGEVRFVLEDTGSGVLGAHGVLTCRSARALALARGVLRLDLAARSAGSPFTLTTPHATCHVTGTRFTVRCDELGSAVTVAEGSVLWQRDGAAPQTVRAGQSARAGAEILFGYDFTDGTARQIGTFPAPVPLTSRDGLRFAEGGLYLTREDFTAVHNPPRPELFGDRLRTAAAVSLDARVRFATAVPRNASIATLISMAPADSSQRFLPVRWRTAGVAAGPRWYDVRVTLQRDGRQRWYVDGQPVDETMRDWIFTDWADNIALRIHTHQDLPDDPVDIIYAWVRVVLH